MQVVTRLIELSPEQHNIVYLGLFFAVPDEKTFTHETVLVFLRRPVNFVAVCASWHCAVTLGLTNGLKIPVWLQQCLLGAVVGPNSYVVNALEKQVDISERV